MNTMKKLLAATVLALAIAGPAVAIDWIVFTSPDGRSSAAFPTPPTESKGNGGTAEEPFATVFYMTKNEGTVYMYGWVDYDPKYNFGIQAELNANRDNFIKGVNGKLLKTTQISYGEHPGIEFTGDNDKLYFQSRVYIVGKRPYQMIVAVPKGQERSPNIDKFLTSFKLK
jgi:hypothetical protein